MNLVWAGLIVPGVAAVAIAAMLLVRRGAPEGSYFEDGDRASGIFGVLATAFAVLIGAISVPGAFLAKAFVERMPVHIHTAILDAAVITGGVVMISSAARTLS